MHWSYRSDVTWTEFNLNSGLERDVLRRALPLVPTESDGTNRIVLDLAEDTETRYITATDTVGATPSGCVDCSVCDRS